MTALALGAGCRGKPRDPLVTYVNAELGVSLRYPASWKSEQAAQGGIWYRYFLGPPVGPQRKSAVTATLLAGPLTTTLDEYAQTYLVGNTLTSTKADTRPGATGKAFEFTSPNGAMRFSLLLLVEQAPSQAPADAPRRLLYGLYCQGESPQFEQHRPLLEEMTRSVAIERPALYPELRDDALRYSLRVPASWKHTRQYSGGGSHVEQFASPALGAERDQTVHASLSLNVDPGPADGRVESYYQATRQMLGENFRVASHSPWKDGLVDVMAVDTPLASSRIKRYFRVSGGRAYSLSCEARDDVYPRISGWCDLIASTLRVGGELK